MGNRVPKQFIKLLDKPVLVHTLLTFDACDAVDDVIVVSPSETMEETGFLLSEYGIEKVTQVVVGGRERQDSVANALNCVPDHADIILVHDGVRPFITQDQIQAVVNTALEYGAAILAVPSVNTLKRVDNCQVVATLDRSQIWQVQTPQAFRFDWLREAYQYAQESGLAVTDDAALVEAMGRVVRVVEGDNRNIKITSPLDLMIGEAILKDAV